MDNSSGGGTPTQPASSPPATPHPPGDPEAGRATQEFTVPVPAYSAPTQALPTTSPAPPPPSEIGPWGAPPPATDPYAAGVPARQAPSDAESLHNLALVLVGVVVGYWLMVVIRMLAHLFDVGYSDRLLIETIDTTAAETLVAALVSVLAVASAVGSRLLSDRRLGGLLVWSTTILAVATVATAVWRLV